MHGARLLQALRRLRPGLEAFGMGGARLASEGLERIARAEELSVMGFAEVAGRLPTILRALSALSSEAARRRPEGAVLIDFPDFHVALARRLRRQGIPLVYYVSPQVWAWRAERARVIARRARRILTLFPFEAEIYRRLGADVLCTGHPIVDDVAEGLARRDATSLPEKNGLRIALLPGSRRDEVARHWPVLRDTVERLARRRRLEAFVVRPSGLPEERYAGASRAGVRFVTAGSHPWIASADLAVVASGTATLETALCGTPMIVVYRTSPTNFAIGRALVKVPWIALVNIVAQEAVVPELLQRDVNPDRLLEEAERLLDSDARRERMKLGLARVVRELGPPGASERAARAILEAVETGTEADARAASR
jgi:lipid-A-disaccharide synthase